MNAHPVAEPMPLKSKWKFRLSDEECQKIDALKVGDGRCYTDRKTANLVGARLRRQGKDFTTRTNEDGSVNLWRAA